eukprot:157249_1
MGQGCCSSDDSNDSIKYMKEKSPLKKKFHPITHEETVECIWDETLCNLFDINGNTVIQNEDEEDGSAFGGQPKSSGSWTIKYKGAGESMAVGIIKNPHLPGAKKEFYAVSGGYGYFGAEQGGLVCNDGTEYGYNADLNYGKGGFKSESTITITFDSKKGNLSFSVDGIDHGTYSIEKVNAVYYLAVYSRDKGDSFTFI